jgi:carbon dioxide concentrating mechanism protein CcmL
MQYGRVCGTVVSTLKHEALEGHKMLLVQLFDVAGSPSGPKTLALDTVGAGDDDWVLVLDEGSSASLVLENPRGPVRTLVVGIVDELHLPKALRRNAP